MEIVFILVEPAVSENVGAAARAIKTMGFEQLRLVNPCDYNNDKARMLAHGSHDILEKAVCYSGLSEALIDIDFVIGTSAKRRAVKVDYISSDKLLENIVKKGNTISKVAIVFGCEESGLGNDELRLCDMVSYVPIVNKYPSLNLAQAVMIYSYSLSKLAISTHHTNKEFKQENSLKALKDRTIQVLASIGIEQDDTIYGRIMERLMLIGEEDVNLLHTITSKIITK